MPSRPLPSPSEERVFGAGGMCAAQGAGLRVAGDPSDGYFNARNRTLLFCDFIVVPKPPIRSRVAIVVEVKEIILGADVVHPFEIKAERMSGIVETKIVAWDGNLHLCALHTILHPGNGLPVPATGASF